MTVSNLNESSCIEIDKLIKSFFSVFDNTGGKQPDFSLLDGMFVKFGMIHKLDKAGVESMDLIAFKTPRIKLFQNGQLLNFHEWETSHKTMIEGNLATRQSKYQKTGFLNGETYQGQGTKHFQLIKTLAGWKITAMTWEDLT